MKKKSIWAFALIAMLTCLGRPAVASDGAFDPVEFVNPLMGTQSSFELSTGNTYPAIARPWGMNFWTLLLNLYMLIYFHQNFYLYYIDMLKIL